MNVLINLLDCIEDVLLAIDCDLIEGFSSYEVQLNGVEEADFLGEISNDRAFQG